MDSGADEGTVDVDGIRRLLERAGVDIPDPSEHNDMSAGMDPADWFSNDVSGRVLSAADILTLVYFYYLYFILLHKYQHCASTVVGLPVLWEEIRVS